MEGILASLSNRLNNSVEQYVEEVGNAVAESNPSIVWTILYPEMFVGDEVVRDR